MPCDAYDRWTVVPHQKGKWKSVMDMCRLWLHVPGQQQSFLCRHEDGTFSLGCAHCQGSSPSPQGAS
eukprot:12143825-Karenia_brevis.AAC.1